MGRRKDSAPEAAGYYSNSSDIQHCSRELFGAPGAASKSCEIFSAVWRAATDPRTDAANIHDTAGESNCLAVACRLFSNSCLQTLEIHTWISLSDLLHGSHSARYLSILSHYFQHCNFSGLLWERRNALACSKGEHKQRQWNRQCLGRAAGGWLGAVLPHTWGLNHHQKLECFRSASDAHILLPFRVQGTVCSKAAPHCKPK